MKLVTSEIFNKLRVFKSMLGSVPPASIWMEHTRH
jgi:hypothetical protein